MEDKHGLLDHSVHKDRLLPCLYIYVDNGHDKEESFQINVIQELELSSFRCGGYSICMCFRYQFLAYRNHKYRTSFCHNDIRLTNPGSAGTFQ
jgi:hypothetical protein